MSYHVQHYLLYLFIVCVVYCVCVSVCLSVCLGEAGTDGCIGRRDLTAAGFPCTFQAQWPLCRPSPTTLVASLLWIPWLCPWPEMSPDATEGQGPQRHTEAQ